jgi:prepilin-type N-terminal cleavage/methylation domain-containing protein
MLTLRRQRRGFTLIEVVISITLVAILSAVVIPTVRARFQDGYEASLVQEFINLAAGVSAYRQDVGKYPERLDYLTALPATPKDFCHFVLTAGDIAKWHGPYVSRNIAPTTFYVINESDSVQVLPVRAASFYQIVIKGPDTRTANDLDLKIDGGLDPFNGTLVWTAAGNATSVTYNIPTRLNAC